MSRQYLKIILIAVLSIIFVALLYFYVSYKDDKADADGMRTVHLTKDRMLSDIDSVLTSFGIKKEWVKEISASDKEKKKNMDEQYISMEIQIPPDLPVIAVNQELTDYFHKNNFELNVIEDPKTKIISMNVLPVKDSLRKQAGLIKFIYSDTIRRNAAEVCLVLDSLERYGLKDVEEIINSVREFSVVLPVRNDKADYQSKIIELNKEYLLKISVGEEDDIEADFKDDMKENVWRSKIKTAGLSFPKTSGVILINKTRNQEFYRMVRDEFTKNNFSVYDDSVFEEFKPKEDKIYSLFEDIITKSKKGKKILFYDINLDPKDFESLDRQVYNMKKLGYKFYGFKDLNKKSSSGSGSGQ